VLVVAAIISGNCGSAVNSLHYDVNIPAGDFFTNTCSLWYIQTA